MEQERDLTGKLGEDATNLHAEILAAMQDGVWATDSDDRIVFFSKAMETIAGVIASDVLGLSIREDFLPETTGQFLPFYEKARNELMPVEYEVPVRTPGGRETVQAGRLCPRVQSGVFAGMICTIRDVTARVRADEALKQSEERRRAQYTKTPAMLHSIDAQGRLLSVSDYWLEKMGYEKDEVIGRASTEFLSDESRERALQTVIPEFFKTGVVRDVPYEFVTKSGEILHVLLSASVERDASGNIVRSLAAINDVTDRTKAEDDLRRSQRLFRELVDASPLAVYETDADGDCTYVNPKWCELSGLSSEEAMGRGWINAIHPEDRDMVSAQWYESANRRESWALEYRFVDREGRESWVFATTFVTRDALGRVSGYVGANADITTNKIAALELERSEALLRAIAANYPDSYVSIIESDMTAGFTSGQEFSKQNLDPNQFVGASLEEIFGDHASTVREYYERTFAGEEQTFELFVNGQHQRYRSVPLVAEDGTIQRILAVAQNVTEQKLVEESLRENRAFNESLLNASPDLIYIYDLGKRANVYSNEGITSVLGYSVEAVQRMGDSVLPSLMHPDDFATYLATILPHYDSAADGELVEHEYRMKHKDGTWRWLHSKESVYRRKPDGRPQQIFGVVSDVTDRVLAEEAVRESEEKYRLLFENMIDGFALHEVVFDTEGLPADYVYLEVNSAFEKITGLHRDETIGRRVSEVIPGIESDSADWIGRYGEIAVTGQKQRFEQYSHALDRWYSVLAFSPKRGQFATIFEDITERRRAERRFELVSKVSTDLIYEWTVGSDHLEWYGPLDETLGYEPGEIPRTISGWVSLIHPEDQERLKDAVERHRVSTEPILEEYRIRHKQGKWMYWVDRGHPVLDAQGKPTMWIGGCIDVTERKESEAALRASEERFRSITAQMSDMIFLTDDTGELLYVSPASEAIFGLEPEEMQGQSFVTFLSPEDIPRAMAVFQNAIDSGVPSTAIELRMTRCDGSTFDGELTGRRFEQNGQLGTIGVIRDITERKRVQREKLMVEAQLRQAQKLESIGTLASGVAHEVNNPLMGMINYAELIKDRVESDERALEYSRAIIGEGNRIATIVRNLLAFARQDEAVSSPAHVSDIVSSALSLLHASLRRHQIQVDLQVSSALPAVRCRSQQIQQVIVNLITNAQGALNSRYPEYDENKILSIRADVFDDDNESWLRVSIEDHGNGIPEELQERVFDPFFTSKSRDQGTGLGLSVSHGIIKDHGGRLTFETREGEFTRFFVDLPLREDALSACAAKDLQDA